MATFSASVQQAGAVTGAKEIPQGWDEYARAIGANLLKAREARGLSQERVAHAADLSSYTYQKFEKGESRPGSPMNPRLISLLALCQVLDIDLVDLLPPEVPDLTVGR